jgi:hypothetical protein
MCTFSFWEWLAGKAIFLYTRLQEVAGPADRRFVAFRKVFCSQHPQSFWLRWQLFREMTA